MVQIEMHFECSTLHQKEFSILFHGIATIVLRHLDGTKRANNVDSRGM